VGIAERYLRKGSKVYIEGKLQTRKWQDQSGADRYTTEVVVGMGGALTMLDGPQGSGGQSQRREPDGSQGHAGGFASDDLSDEIPFATSNSIF